MNQTKIRLMDVKAALMDARFRDKLPSDLLPDIQQFLKNPGCACNVPIYRKIMQQCAGQLRAYFPGKEVETPEEDMDRLSKNYWSVVNCHIDDLESKLRSLHKSGRKQLAIARHGDQVTVVINELDVLY